MQAIFYFLNQGWVGAIIGVAGVALALISLLLFWRSRISGLVALQSRSVSMIAGGNPVFPDGVEVQYRGTPVQRLTSSTVWIWNAGKKTVRGVDIVGHDPLRLRFSGEVLNVRIRKVTRKVLKIIVDTSKEEKKSVCYSFEFLDPDDGGVLEVLHTGPPTAPACTGTIIGPSKGPRYVGSFGPQSELDRKLLFLSAILLILLGLVMIVEAILGDQYFEETLPTLVGLSSWKAPTWTTVAFGLLTSSFGGFFLWFLRSRVPSSLDVD